jgi:hypothetical protein
MNTSRLLAIGVVGAAASDRVSDESPKTDRSVMDRVEHSLKSGVPCVIERTLTSTGRLGPMPQLGWPVRRATAARWAWWEVVVYTALVVAAICSAGGAVWGFVRGLDYLPTLPFAVVEGGLLFGIPGGLLGLALGSLIALGRALRRAS